MVGGGGVLSVASLVAASLGNAGALLDDVVGEVREKRYGLARFPNPPHTVEARFRVTVYSGHITKD